MINVDLSNVWSRISLPDLLERERDIFDAHLRLRSNSSEDPAFCGWLGASESQTAKMLHGINRAAERIRSDCRVLIVVGVGSAFAAARAGVQLLAGWDPDAPQIVFTGCDLCSRAWTELCRTVEKQDVCLFVLQPDEGQPEPAIASRAVRWMLNADTEARQKRESTFPRSRDRRLPSWRQRRAIRSFPCRSIPARVKAR